MKFQLERIVGGTESQRAEALDDIRSNFESQSPEIMVEMEVEKTQEEIEYIRIADEVALIILRNYGIDTDSIPNGKFHALKIEVWPENIPDSPAFFSSFRQSIFYKEGTPGLFLIHNLIHEIIHFKSYQAAQITTENSLTDYRVGLTVATRDGKTDQFRNLNEAITEDLTYEAMQTQEFRELAQDKIKEKESLIQAFDRQHNLDMNKESDPSVFYVEVLEGEAHAPIRLDQYEFTYKKEREGLRILIDKLLEKNKDLFTAPEDVRMLFVKSAFSGDLLEIGRLIEKTFGKGTFRKIAENDSEDDFLNFVRAL